MSKIKVFENDDVREIVFEAPPETPEAMLESAANRYMKAHPFEFGIARVIEDEEADETGPACRVLRMFVQ